MESINIKKLNTVFAIIAIFALTSVVLFGLSFSMFINKDGTMQNCLFSNGMGICPMSFSEHLNLWQSTFVANLTRSMSASLNATMLLFILALAVALTHQFSRFTKNQHYQTLYLKQKPYLFYFDYLKEAFSQGIIKPKIYQASF